MTTTPRLPETTPPPRLLDATAMARWERYRAGGRSAFVWRYGVGGFGLPAALVTIAYKVIQEQGWTWSLAMSPHLRHGIAAALVAFPLAGYLFGRRLWDLQEQSYDRTLAARDPAGPSPA